MTSNFHQALKTSSFVVTCELPPPKGTQIQTLIDHTRPLHGLVSAINITDGQSGNMRMNSVIASHLLEKNTGIEAICQLVCRDRNRIALQSDLLGAGALGLKNFLALNGDKADGGEYPDAKEVFDLNTDQLIELFRSLSEGKELNGKTLTGGLDDICLGAAAHPGAPDLKSQAEKMKLRKEKGVHFFQTQIVYEPEQLKRFAESVLPKIEAPILIGITPLKSLKMAEFIHTKVFGVEVPESLFKLLIESSNPAESSLDYCRDLVKTARKLGFQGIHIMAVGQEENLAKIIERLSS
ncbi:MAG: methylenetetrahydrofolate reductase [Candidatus Caenarcaniphilales bacterium]|nr:methylenetetrahydrofolate reductase [Candidatus Caenarcaniphilales bacterium]